MSAGVGLLAPCSRERLGWLATGAPLFKSRNRDLLKYVIAYCHTIVTIDGLKPVNPVDLITAGGRPKVRKTPTNTARVGYRDFDATVFSIFKFDNCFHDISFGWLGWLDIQPVGVPGSIAVASHPLQHAGYPRWEGWCLRGVVS